MATTTFQSLACIVLLRSLTAAVGELQSPTCTASDKSSCISHQSWTKAIDAEDGGQGLELLQVKGSEVVSRKICPVPDILSDKAEFSTVGKGCPNPGKDDKGVRGWSCVDGNRAYDTFSNAWEKCGLTVDCGSVMKYSDGMFYLRRGSDPDEKMENVKVFTYTCSSYKKEQKEIEKAADHKAKQLAEQMREEQDRNLKEEVKSTRKDMEEGFSKAEQVSKDRAEKDAEIVAETEAKVAVLNKVVAKLPEEIKQETKDAAEVYSRLQTAQKVAATAEAIVKQDEQVLKEDEKLKEKVKEEDDAIKEANRKYEEIAQTAEKEMQTTKELEGHLDTVKKTALKKIVEAKHKAKEAASSKEKIAERLHDVVNTVETVEDELQSAEAKGQINEAVTTDMESEDSSEKEVEDAIAETEEEAIMDSSEEEAIMDSSEKEEGEAAETQEEAAAQASDENEHEASETESIFPPYKEESGIFPAVDVDAVAGSQEEAKKGTEEAGEAGASDKQPDEMQNGWVHQLDEKDFGAEKDFANDKDGQHEQSEHSDDAKNAKSEAEEEQDLPDGWLSGFDPKYQTYYYYRKGSTKTQWEKPTAEDEELDNARSEAEEEEMEAMLSELDHDQWAKAEPVSDEAETKSHEVDGLDDAPGLV